MRCNVLYFNHNTKESKNLISYLAYEGLNATIEPIQNIDTVEEQSKAKKYDIAVAQVANKEALSVAKKLRGNIAEYELPLLFIIEKEDMNLLADLKDIGINNTLVGPQAVSNQACFISTIVSDSRAKSELHNMNSYIREACVVIEKDENNNLKIVEVNSSFIELENSTREEIIGQNLAESNFTFTIDSLADDVLEVFETGTALHLPSFFYLNDGARKWFDIYIYKSATHHVSIIGAQLTEVKRAHDKAEESRRYLQTILNAQKHIIYITDAKSLINVNNAFLSYFGFATMYDFLQEHNRVCELFEESTESNYISSKTVGWLENVLQFSDIMYKIRIQRDGVVSVFVPDVEKIIVNGKKQYVVILTNITELEYEKEKLRVVAMTDSLTGASNRFKFNALIEEQLASTKRYKSDLSIVMFDIDDFKAINDAYSHNTGDEVLKTMAHLVMDDIRESDVFVRWGGEEFVLILSNTNVENAVITAEKIRTRFENYDFGEVGQVTSSFGVTSFKENDSITTLMNRADEAMYQAKKSGKNCTHSL